MQTLISFEGDVSTQDQCCINFGGHTTLTRVWNDDDTFSDYVLFVYDCCSFSSVTIKFSQLEGEQFWAKYYKPK